MQLRELQLRNWSKRDPGCLLVEWRLLWGVQTNKSRGSGHGAKLLILSLLIRLVHDLLLASAVEKCKDDQQCEDTCNNSSNDGCHVDNICPCISIGVMVRNPRWCSSYA